MSQYGEWHAATALQARARSRIHCNQPLADHYPRLDSQIRYGVIDNGTVVVTRNDDGLNHDDPVINEFLAFLETDIEANVGNVRPIPQELLTRARDLTDGVTVDLDGPLDPEDE